METHNTIKLWLQISRKSDILQNKKVLPRIINRDQTGFLKGRFIGENIRLINEIIDYCNIQNIKGLLLFLDFEKAFNTVEWNFIYTILKKYNFGDNLISWIKLLYTNTESCILNNGWSSWNFKIGRGLRQGCPLSPYLLIICVEALATAVRCNENIKGISVKNEECKISQYADDSILILDGNILSFEHVLKLLDEFAYISGLKVNYDKTEALWIGSMRESIDIFFPEKKNSVVKR